MVFPIDYIISPQIIWTMWFWIDLPV
jgi:hypothetical protein